MDKELQRTTIAEICGFLRHGGGPYWAQVADRICGYLNGEIAFIPDYLNNLDAMHQAEKTIPEDLLGDYASLLDWVMCIDVKSENYRRRKSISATSEQRAEAFLRLHNKWID